MPVTTTKNNGCDVVKMDGRIDSNTTVELKEAFSALTDEKRYKIVFDMTEVEFISSAGVWALLETQKACKRWNRGDLVLANASEDIQYTLDLAGLKHFMKIYEDVAAACEGF
jgi:anti-sigma B factor antagonist